MLTWRLNYGGAVITSITVYIYMYIGSIHVHVHIYTNLTYEYLKL